MKLGLNKESTKFWRWILGVQTAVSSLTISRCLDKNPSIFYKEFVGLWGVLPHKLTVDDHMVHKGWNVYAFWKTVLGPVGV